MQNDSGFYNAGDIADGTMNWEDALAWAQEMNEQEFLGYSDWRLPNIKELQSLVDYEQGMQFTGTAAIDPIFSCTPTTTFFGEEDYGFYWSSTTHDDAPGGGESLIYACYVIFGNAWGFFDGEIQDVHGSGAQRSDPKFGDRDTYPLADPGAPQGDEQRVFNMVRLVRDAE